MRHDASDAELLVCRHVGKIIRALDAYSVSNHPQVQSKSYQQALRVFRATSSYREAVADLLTREGKWIAERVGINESLSCDPNEVGSPSGGINGSATGPNYTFSFYSSRFQSVRWHEWHLKIKPPALDMIEFSKRPCQLDNETALELAHAWLSNLGVDLAALAVKSSPRVFQVPGNSVRDIVPGQPRPMRPQFVITWLGPSSRTLQTATGVRAVPGEPLIRVEILGTTKQLIELSIHADEIWPRAGLELKDADKLLGPEPSPAELMAKILTNETYEAIANPDSIEAWLLTSDANGQPKRDRVGPVKFERTLGQKFSAALLDFDSYNTWDGQKGCITDDGARLLIKRGETEVHVRFCFECDILVISRGTTQREINFDQGHDRFADLFREVFPGDAVVRGIPRRRQ